LIVDKHIDLNVYKEAKNLEDDSPKRSEYKGLNTSHDVRPSCCESGNSSSLNKMKEDRSQNLQSVSDIDFNDWVGQYYTLHIKD